MLAPGQGPKCAVACQTFRTLLSGCKAHAAFISCGGAAGMWCGMSHACDGKIGCMPKLQDLTVLFSMGQVRTLIAKLIGVVFSIAAGLIAGKEGPFVHGGGIVGGGIGSLGSQYVAASSSCETP